MKKQYQQQWVLHPIPLKQCRFSGLNTHYAAKRHKKDDIPFEYAVFSVY